MSEPPAGEALEPRVTPLELFFDLVFVFAITRVTTLMAHDLTWRGLAQGLLVSAALWWAWSAYAWLTNHVSGEDGRARVAVFVAMGAMALVALSVPEAFDEHALVFGLAYLVVRVAHVALYWVATRGDDEQHAAIARLAPTALGAPLLLVAAAFLDGAAQAALWTIALVIDYGGPLVTGPRGYRVHAHHFAERFGLIVIIALGESLVAIGVGAGDEPLTAAIAAAAVLGVAISAALWWAYFDVVAPVAERRLAGLEGVERARLARDSFAYLHLPMIMGIQFAALGVEQVVAHVDEELKAQAAVALYGGVATYLLAHIAFRWRNVHSLNRQRLVTALVLLAAIPLVTEVRSLTALAALAAVCATLIAYEAIRLREARARIRLALR